MYCARIIWICFLLLLVVNMYPLRAQEKIKVTPQQRHEILMAMQDIEDRMTRFLQEPTQEKLDELAERFSKNIKYIPPKKEVAILGAITMGRASKKFKLEINGEGHVFNDARAVRDEDKEHYLVKFLADEKKISPPRIKAWWYSFFATGETKFLDPILKLTGDLFADDFQGQRQFALIANGDLMRYSYFFDDVAKFCKTAAGKEKDPWRRSMLKSCVSWNKFIPDDFEGFELGTPEGILRLFVLGTMTSNEDLIRISTYPMLDEELDHLLSDKLKQDSTVLQETVAKMVYRRMKAGDHWTTASGKEIKIPAEFDTDRAVNAYLEPLPKGAPPFGITKIYGSWWVDPAPVITMRKATAKLDRRSKK